ncbi:hypothetical protein D6817_01855, partial [Candidatus Pacearchaeota archaeon]
MRSGILLALVAAGFLLAPIASALATDMKDVVQPRETVIASLDGIVMNYLTRDNMKIYKQNSPTQVPFEGGIVPINGRYYFWFNAPTPPNTEQNYTLVIENILTVVNGQRVMVDFTKNFKVAGSVAHYSLNPGVVLAASDFSIYARLNTGIPETIEVDFPSSRQVLLYPGNNRIDFSIASLSGVNTLTINVGSYAVPALIYAPEQQGQSGGNDSSGGGGTDSGAGGSGGTGSGGTGGTGGQGNETGGTGGSGGAGGSGTGNETGSAGGGGGTGGTGTGGQGNGNGGTGGSGTGNETG